MSIGHAWFDKDGFRENLMPAQDPSDGPLGMLTVRDVLRVDNIEDLRQVMRARRQRKSVLAPRFSLRFLDNFGDGFILGLLTVCSIIGPFWVCAGLAGLLVITRTVIQPLAWSARMRLPPASDARDAGEFLLPRPE